MTRIVPPRTQGFHAFTLICFGQLSSFVGSHMTRFALGLWAWDRAGTATALALVWTATWVPRLLLQPVAGVVVDRVPRKWVLLWSDAASAGLTALLLTLHLHGKLEIWHLYVAAAGTGAMESFQGIAFQASITTMVERRQYVRANAIFGLSSSASSILGPMAGAMLISVIGLRGIMIADLATFLFATLTISSAAIPDPISKAAPQGTSWGRRIAKGLQLLFLPRFLPLLRLAGTAVVLNFVFAVGWSLRTPQILARSAGDERALGATLACLGIGGLTGSGAMVVTGQRIQKRVRAYLLLALIALLALGSLGVGRSLIAWSAALFWHAFCFEACGSLNRSVWQSAVPPEIQGRIFATKTLLSTCPVPLATAFAGPLADQVLPAFISEESPLLQRWFGADSGAHMGLLLSASSILAGIFLICLMQSRSIRQLDSIASLRPVPNASTEETNEEKESV